MLRARFAAGIVAAGVLAAGCGPPQKTPKVDAAAERAAATERAKEGAFGNQVKSLESAGAMQADLDRKARESVEKMEK
jgi:hypothetical protein